MITLVLQQLSFPDVVFSILILALGLVISYEDIRFGKIRNLWIIRGLIAGSALHGLFIVFYNLLPGNLSVDLSYIQLVILNTAIAFFCSILMWKMKVWSAGDSKLFTLFAFLLPLNYYANSFINYFPAMNLLINIFAVSFIAVLIKVITAIVKSVCAGEFKLRELLSSVPKQTATVAYSFLRAFPSFLVVFAIFNAIFFIVHLLQSATDIPEISFIINVGTLIFMFTVMSKISAYVTGFVEKHPISHAAILIFIPITVYFIISRTPEAGTQLQSSAKIILIFMVVIGAIRKGLDFYLRIADVNKITVNELEPGMVLSNKTIHSLPKEVLTETFFMDGLSREFLATIKDSMANDQEVEIVSTIPFAPLAYLGLLMTMLTQQSAIRLIANLLK
jgi:hypothetical protein